MADGYGSAVCSTKKMMRRDSGQCTLTSHVLCIHASPCCCKRKKRAVFHFCLPDLTRRNSCYYNLNQSPTTKDSLAPVSAVPKLRSPDVEKTQGSQATATSHEWVTGKKPHSVHGVLLLLLHRWSFGSNLEATRTVCNPWGNSRASTGYRIL